MSTELVRKFPDMAPELLSSPFGVELPAFATVAAWEREGNHQSPFWLERYHSLRDRGRTIAPLWLERYEPEQQVILGYADLVDKHPAHVILFEGLRGGDDEKRFSWPFRVAELWTRYRCNVTMLVFCADIKTETWVAQTVSTGQPNWEFRPLVLGNGTTPVITTPPGEARRNPPMSILSAMCHAGDPEQGDNVFLSMLPGLAALGEDLVEFCLNRLLAAFDEKDEKDEKVANHLKGLLSSDPRIEDFYGAFGRSDGIQEGTARSLLRVLQARDIDVPEKARQTILRSRPERLDDWLTKAATTKEAYEIFDAEEIFD